MHGLLEGPVHLNMPGHFNVENALIATAITAKIGIDKNTIAKALSQVAVRGRTQVLQEVAGFTTFLIDYAHNAISMESLLSMLKGYQPDRLICLFGGGGNKPKQRRFDMGQASGKYADLTVITMDNPRFESMDDINADIIKGIDSEGGRYQIIPDRKDAIEYLIDHAGKKDIVALIGKGHEEYQEVMGVKYPFSEWEIVREYAKSRK
jgi:UDP-N-acetylmuramoyl-L-alanyl-D-glutamate--2,6-diaminopimelate ligase